MIKKILTRISHPHLIKIQDIATGVNTDGCVPVTAYWYRCVLCDRRFHTITRSGLDQIASGHGRDEVLHWQKYPQNNALSTLTPPDKPLLEVTVR